jgi:predicted phage terminase large subunit-like protein
MRAFAHTCGEAYVPGWHIEVMAAKLASVRERGKRLVVMIPPRHLKSLAASIALPAWLLGHDPRLQIVSATYAQDLSDKFASQCRALMTSDWYRDAFTTRLKSARPPLRELVTTRGGSRLATSIGGVLTGRGADVIVIDDPLKAADAMSETRRTAVNAWFDGTLAPRLNDKAMGSIVIVMQRLHEDDLVGHVLKGEGFEVVAFPAIAETDETHVVDTAFGEKIFGRDAGEALHPEREPLKVLTRLRRTMGEANFAGQYQQRPHAVGGGLVKSAWFRRYAEDERPRRFDAVIQSWDTANTASELADFSVCTTWGSIGERVYFLDVFRRRLAFPDLFRAVQAESERHAPSVILIEDRASGTQLIQTLLASGIANVKAAAPRGDKIMRMHAHTAMIENGFVFLPREAPWLNDYLDELMAFPAGRHDDQVDSTAQALAFMTRPRVPGFLEHWRRMAEGV